jgi:type II secretory pathway component PulM
MQLLAGIGQKVDALEHKVNALATVHQQATAVRALPARATRATPAPVEMPEDTAEDDTTTALAQTPKPRTRINRSSLLEFFD